jgi:hypothetical protein
MKQSGVPRSDEGVSEELPLRPIVVQAGQGIAMEFEDANGLRQIVVGRVTVPTSSSELLLELEICVRSQGGTPGQWERLALIDD